MKKGFLTVLAMLAILFSQAQSKSSSGSTYKTALGVKVWDGGGISFKHFVSNKNALEFIGYFWNQGTRITGLYEIHMPISDASGLQWYIGPGAHIGVYNTKYGDGAFIGVDGVLGLDYKFKKAPLNMSLDWQPSFEFGDNRGFVGSWGGLGIRYTF
ncbi:MAG: hypothetical protein SGI96_09745 [Bacteroidota bacterium]|nr:hypothetical protein [Chitinophagaceae bacterium]MDZ4808541.1 hypothetical protein [Bacteroidota bacterium]